MAMRERRLLLRMDESMWRLLNLYTGQVTRLVNAREQGHLSHMQERRLNSVVNAIVLKFLLDHGARIKHVEQATKLRQAIRLLPSPELRAQAAATADRALAAAADGTTGGAEEAGAVP